MTVIEVWVNCPDREVAARISAALIAERVVACANILAGIDSVYRWKGSVERATEFPLVAKTRGSLFDAVCRRVKSLHPYETPAITGVAIDFVDRDYEAWIVAETAVAAP